MQRDRQRFDRYRERTFESRFITHEWVQSHVKQIGLYSDRLSISSIGHSAEKREIYRLSLGTGDCSVLLWSQMHGDESTATLAMFDVLNFLLGDDDQNDLRSRLLQSCTFHFIPMLNPDGAERWQRRNAQGIDINRDLLALQSPEARLLKGQQELLRPAVAFNLHDQDSLWSVQGSGEPALISLLAPPAERSLEFTSSMRRAAQIIASVYSFLEEEIPGKIGRWKDEYEPRAAGETFQRGGSATILIESGGYNDETSKQYVRKLNFDILIHAFEEIAFGTRFNESTALQIYNTIPVNTKEIYHLIIRNCRLPAPGGVVSMDIALNHDSIDKLEERLYRIADMGDLSPFGAYFEIDAEGAEIQGASMKVDHKASFRLEMDDQKIINIEEGILKQFNFVS